jgi:hypothetical protein
MALLLTGFLASGMLAISDQPSWVLGVEYLVLAVRPDNHVDRSLTDVPATRAKAPLRGCSTPPNPH